MNKKSKRLISFLAIFLMIFSMINFSVLNSVVYAKETNEQNIDLPNSIEVVPGEELNLKLKPDKGNYFVYKSTIPSLKYGKIKLSDEIKITIPKGTKLGNYKLNNLAIYDINEGALMSLPAAFRSQRIDQQIKFKTGKICDLHDIDIIVKDKKNSEQDKVISETKEDEIVDSKSENGNTIKVRVEGEKETLLKKQFNIKSEVYVKDLVSNAIGKENIKGLEKSFIHNILGEEATTTSGWMYYLVDKKGQTLLGNSINTQKIKDIKGNYYKEMVWFMAKWTGGTTFVPKIDIQNTGNIYKLKITENNTMLGVDPRPSKDVNVKVEGVGEYKTDEKGEVSFKVTGGEHKVNIYKNVKDSDGNYYPAIVRQSLIIKGEKSKSEIKLEDIIKDIKKYYECKNNTTCLNTISFNHISFGEKKNFKLEKSTNVSAIADNIIGIIAIGKNPYDYEGVNYVDKLSKAQKDDGSFIIGDNDKDSVTAQAEAIIAMDMASAKYNVEKALNYVMGLSNDGEYEDIDSTTRVLIALSKHKYIDEAKKLIDSCIKYLKDRQLEGGGFDYSGLGNSPYSTAPAIQALIALGEDPASDKWKKGSKTPIDALLSCKVSDNGFEMAEGMGGGASESMATDLALAAIADLYKQESMYNSFLFKIEKKQESNKIIDNEIEDIKNFYEKKFQYDFNSILGLNVSGVDSKKLESKISLKNKDIIMSLAEDIISIVGAGKDPRNYNGKNYVKQMMDTLKGPKGDRGKFTRNRGYFYGLIAANMVSADKQDINVFLEKIKREYRVDGFKTKDEAPLAIIALSPYKDNEDANEIINTCLTYLKQEQLDNGAFTLDSKRYKDGDSQYTGLAIEALVSIGEDPLSAKWTKNNRNLQDALLSFKLGNGYIFNSNIGTLNQEIYTGFVLRALLALKNGKTIFEESKINYDSSKDKTLIIKNIISELRKQYKSKRVYDFREALAFNYSSDSAEQYLQDVNNKYKNIEECKTVSDIAKNIMGIVAGGNNPKKFNDKNYVEMLSSHQVKNGENKGKFILAKEDSSNVTTQAYAIIALDMANGKYDKESAIKALLSMNKDGAYGDINTTSQVIIALSRHNNSEEVNKIISYCIEFIKHKQSIDAGFSDNIKTNLINISNVMQALIANKVDPLASDWTKNGNTMLDVILKSGLEKKITFSEEDIQVFMALADLYKGESMFKAIKTVGSINFDGMFNGLKDYYENQDNNYNYIQALSLNKLGVPKDVIASRLQLREEEPEHLNFDFPTVSHCKNIIAILSAGLDPKDYKGKNYIKILKDSQNNKGEFKVSKKEDYSPISQAYSIIALDMCKESYNVKDAIDVLKDSLKDRKSSRLIRLAPTMIALSNHRDIMGVNIILKNCTLSLKNLQQDSGEFSQSGRPGEEICSEDTALAIQALVAVGEDVLSPKWQINGKSPIDALMKYKVENHFIYDNIKYGYDEYTDEATGIAMAALIDVYNNESMFKGGLANIVQEVDPNVHVKKDIDIQNLTIDKQFILGSQAEVVVKAINRNKDNKDNKDVALIVGIFNKDGKLMSYGAAEKNIKKNEDTKLQVTLSIPKQGQYKVKAFVWDSLEKMNCLSNVIEIPVK